MRLSKYIIYSTLVTVLLSLIPMLMFKSRLPAEVPIHFDMKGNVNGTMSKALFVYGMPLRFGLFNLVFCLLSFNMLLKKPMLWSSIVPISCFAITLLMLYLALK